MRYPRVRAPRAPSRGGIRSGEAAGPGTAPRTKDDGLVTDGSLISGQEGTGPEIVAPGFRQTVSAAGPDNASAPSDAPRWPASAPDGLRCRARGVRPAAVPALAGGPVVRRGSSGRRTAVGGGPCGGRCVVCRADGGGHGVGWRMAGRIREAPRRSTPATTSRMPSKPSPVSAPASCGPRLAPMNMLHP